MGSSHAANDNPAPSALRVTPVPEGEVHLCAGCRKISSEIALAVTIAPKRLGVSPVAWLCRSCQLSAEKCLSCGECVGPDVAMCAPCQSDYEWALLVASHASGR